MARYEVRHRGDSEYPFIVVDRVTGEEVDAFPTLARANSVLSDFLHPMEPCHCPDCMVGSEAN